MSLARWYAKADAYAAAWLDLHPGTPTPTLASIALGLAVAELETACGDAWAGERNWGACTGRALTAPEHGAIAAAGVHPIVKPASARLAAEAAARAAIEAAVEAHQLAALAKELDQTQGDTQAYRQAGGALLEKVRRLTVKSYATLEIWP